MLPWWRRPQLFGRASEVNCNRSYTVGPWTDVGFESTTGKIQTKVTAATDTRGSLDPSVPARVFLARPGQSGDSGALVIDSGGLGVGIYMGAIADASSTRTKGMRQHLAQAGDTMGLTLHG
jgi:hypothetical protein